MSGNKCRHGLCNNRQKIKYGILLAVILGVTAFIFGNSLLGYNMSHNTSDSVSKLLLPSEYSHDETALLLIRKSAHLIEYAALGFAVMLFVKHTEKDYGKRLYGLALFYVLLVAVLDEYIQSFSDRNSSTGDILLDFLGGLLGFVVALGMNFVHTKLKNRKVQ